MLQHYYYAVVKPITVDIFASLFICTMLCWASDWMTAPFTSVSGFVPDYHYENTHIQIEIYIENFATK